MSRAVLAGVAAQRHVKISQYVTIVSDAWGPFSLLREVISVSDTVQTAPDVAHEQFRQCVAEFHDSLRMLAGLEERMQQHLNAMQEQGASSARIMTAITMLGAVRQVLRAGPRLDERKVPGRQGPKRSRAA